MIQVVSDGLAKMAEAVETKVNFDTSRRKHGRGRSPSVSGRGRGARGNDQMRSQNSLSTSSLQNGQADNSSQKVCSQPPASIKCFF